MYINQFRVYDGHDFMGRRRYWQGSFISGGPFGRFQNALVKHRTTEGWHLAEVHQSTATKRTSSESLFEFKYI